MKWSQMIEGVTKKAANCDVTRSAYFSTLVLKSEGAKEVKKDICWHTWDLQSSTFQQFCSLVCLNVSAVYFLSLRAPRQEACFLCAAWSSDERGLSVWWHELHQELLLMKHEEIMGLFVSYCLTCFCFLFFKFCFKAVLITVVFC